jgi:hypothetical protein
MKIHEKDDKYHVFERHYLPGNEIDFEIVEILDRAGTIKKRELKEMLYIRKIKPNLNYKLESVLFTLIIRNVKLEASIIRDSQKYLTKPKTLYLYFKTNSRAASI